MESLKKVLNEDAIRGILARTYGVTVADVDLHMGTDEEGSSMIEAVIYQTHEQLENNIAETIACNMYHPNNEKEIEETREELRNMLHKISRLYNKEEMGEFLTKYHDEEGYPKTQKAHNIVTGDAVKLARDVMRRGGTKEEVDLALTYLMLCINSHKHKLSVYKFRQENDIQNLRKKYQPNRFKKHIIKAVDDQMTDDPTE